jgi:hypothetical protein
MTTKSTPAKRGRKPAAKPVAETASPKKAKRSIQRKEMPQALEYEATRSRGVMMLMQTGVTVYDEEADMVREIRYCENEPSIYKDEQNEKSVKTPIVFRLGKMMVRRTQPNLMEFMSKHPDNEKNGGSKFRVVEKEKKAEVSVDREFLVMDAVSLIRTKDLDDLLAVAISFNINIDRAVNEIKHDLIVKAKSAPDTFIKAFDNPIVAMKASIKQAEKMQIILIHEDSIRWFDTNKNIITVPPGKDPTDTFVRFCLTEQGSTVAAEMERQLS